MALRFTPGTSSMTANFASLVPNAPGITVGFWVKTIVASTGVIVNLPGSTAVDIEIDSGIIYELDDTGTLFTFVTGLAGRWNYVMFSNAGASYTAAWSDTDGQGHGNILQSKNVTGIIQQNGFASIQLPGASWNGSLAGLKVWADVLTIAEVQQEMYRIKPQRSKSLVGWWPLQSRADGNEDYSGNGQNFSYGAVLPSSDVGPPCHW